MELDLVIAVPADVLVPNSTRAPADILQMAKTCFVLTLKHWEMHWCIVSTMATYGLVLKHHAISILSTD